MDGAEEDVQSMIRTLLLGMLLCICILIGIGFVCVPFLIDFELDTPATIRQVAFSVLTGCIIIIGSFRALISATRRPRS